MCQEQQEQDQQETKQEKRDFSDFQLDERILRALEEMEFTEPSPVQAATIPYILSGKDIIGQARTGTGKTAAFGIPIAQALRDSEPRVSAIVLTPTRELCHQVARELERITAHLEISVLAVYGGTSISGQVKKLERGVHIIVGTPGRTMDLMRRGHLRLSGVKIAVLDEADEMLDMGFIDDIRYILGKTPRKRQTLLFSATMPRPIRRLAEFYMNKPRTLDLSGDGLTGEQTAQFFYEVDSRGKFEVLCDLLDHEQVGLGLVFCRTKISTGRLSARLKGRGFDAYALHGDLSQGERSRIMEKFRNRDLHVMVATDVAARGIDVSDVTHVINYELPQDPELYVHRIGRTGRMGKVGKALTLVTRDEFYDLHTIQERLDVEIERAELPDREEIIVHRLAEHLHDFIAEVPPEELGPHRRLMEDVADYYDLKEAAAILFKLLHDARFSGGWNSGYARTGASRQGRVRFHANLGRNHGVTADSIITRVATTADIAKSHVGQVRIHEDFSFFEVPLSDAEKVHLAFAETGAGEDAIRVKPAKPRQRSDSGITRKPRPSSRGRDGRRGGRGYSSSAGRGRDRRRRKPVRRKGAPYGAQGPADSR